jgi:hypothetical protein
VQKSFRKFWLGSKNNVHLRVVQDELCSCIIHWNAVSNYCHCTTHDFLNTLMSCCRSQWPRGLRHELSSLDRTLRSWVRIPLKGMDVSVCVYSVFVLSCVGSAFATIWSPIHGVLPTVLGLRSWSERERFKHALCSKVGATGKRERE